MNGSLPGLEAKAWYFLLLGFSSTEAFRALVSSMTDWADEPTGRVTFSYDGYEAPWTATGSFRPRLSKNPRLCPASVR